MTIAGDRTVGVRNSTVSSYALAVGHSSNGGVYVTGNNSYGVRTVGSPVRGVSGESARATGIGVQGIVTGATGTNISLKGIATTTNTGMILNNVRTPNCNTGLSLFVGAGDIQTYNCDFSGASTPILTDAGYIDIRYVNGTVATTTAEIVPM